jgi:hypothetical protein
MPSQRLQVILACPAGELVTPLPWLPSAAVVALAGDANGSAAATTPQIAMSMSGTLRIMTPRTWMPGNYPGINQYRWPVSPERSLGSADRPRRRGDEMDEVADSPFVGAGAG